MYRLHDVKLSCWEQFRVVLVNKATDRLLKSNVDQSRLVMTFPQAKQIILFFSRYIIAKETFGLTLL